MTTRINEILLCVVISELQIYAWPSNMSTTDNFFTVFANVALWTDTFVFYSEVRFLADDTTFVRKLIPKISPHDLGRIQYTAIYPYKLSVYQ